MSNNTQQETATATRAQKKLSIKCIGRAGYQTRAHYLITTQNGTKIDVFVGNKANHGSLDSVFVNGENANAGIDKQLHDRAVSALHAATEASL